MNKNLTWIVNILDESGSMSDIKSDTIGAYNGFIREQKKVEGEAECFLVKFNTKIEKVYEKMNIQNVSLIDENSYKPCNYTKLLDAIGHTLKDVKMKIKSLSDEDKPEKVLFVITTDGKENRSTDFTREKIFEKIQKCEKKGYRFIYLGANQDAIQEGGKIGINKFNTVTWSADANGINTAFNATNNYTTKYRNAKTSAELASLDLNQEYKDAEKKM
jgi:uncharacterized protein YfkK (UPF0435 family)